MAAQVLRDGDREELYLLEPASREYTVAAEHARASLAVSDSSTQYVYPALFAKLLAASPWTTWLGLFRFWLIVMTTCLWLGFVLSFRLVRSVTWEAAAILALLAANLLESSSQCMWNGQLTPFVFLLIAASLHEYEHKRGHVAGALLGVAVFLKLTPVILLVVWIAHRSWRAIVGFAATVVASSVVSIAWLGIPVHVNYIRKIWQSAGWALASFNTHSISSFVARLYASPADVLSWTPHPLPWGARTWIYVIDAALLLVFVKITRDSVKTRDARLASAAALLLMLALPPFSWTHYAVLLVPAFALMATRMREAMPSGSLYALVGGVLLFLARPIQPAQPPSPYDRFLMDGYTVIFVLGVLGIAFLARAAPAPRAENDARSARR